MLPYVDYYNIISYDIHGTWDGNSEHTNPVINPHTNLTVIAQGLDLLWRNLVGPSKVNLGLAFYGRSFRLEDNSCNVPGYPFYKPSGRGANPGSCTGTSGILLNYEVHRILKNYRPEVIYDADAGVN
jgi:chitinase